MGRFCSQGEVVEALREASNIILLTHNDPDGDALGAQLSLGRGLKTLDKTVRMINVGKLQPYYQWLLKEDEAEFYTRSGPFPQTLQGDLIVALDFNGWNRLLGFGTIIEQSMIKTVVIDHHPSDDASADHTFTDVTACATGILVLEILQELGVEISFDIAEPAYVSLITDTGHFRFSNTDKRAHDHAGKLIEKGIKPQMVYRKIFESSTLSRLKLMGHALTHLKTSLDGQVAWVTVTKEEMDKFGSCPEETEGFMDVIRTLDTMEVAAIFRATDNGQVKVSLRSRGRIDLSKFAAQFGGGGHPRASGITFDESLDEVVGPVIKALEQSLSVN